MCGGIDKCRRGAHEVRCGCMGAMWLRGVLRSVWLVFGALGRGGAGPGPRPFRCYILRGSHQLGLDPDHRRRWCIGLGLGGWGDRDWCRRGQIWHPCVEVPACDCWIPARVGRGFLSRCADLKGGPPTPVRRGMAGRGMARWRLYFRAWMPAEVENRCLRCKLNSLLWREGVRGRAERMTDGW